MLVLISMGPLSKFGRSAWLVVFCACVASIVALPGNNRRNRYVPNSESLATVFADFTFVGQNACKEVEFTPHGMASLPAPKKFQAGVCYAYLFPSTSDRPLYELIEQRLRSCGTSILRSPSINHELIHLVLGGPLFRIDFQKGRHEGVIAAVQDPLIAGDAELRKIWKSEDFVLLFHPSNNR